jgi:hypothetical protein
VYVKEFLGFDIEFDYISVASRWLHKEKYYVANTISTSYVRLILRKITMLSVEWRLIYKEPKMKETIKWLSFLERPIQEPLRIANA